MALEAGHGTLRIEEVKALISDPLYNLPINIPNAPAEGLSLIDVQYDPERLKYASDSIEDLPIGPTPEEEFWRPEIKWLVFSQFLFPLK